MKRHGGVELFRLARLKFKDLARGRALDPRLKERAVRDDAAAGAQRVPPRFLREARVGPLKVVAGLFLEGFRVHEDVHTVRPDRVRSHSGATPRARGNFVARIKQMEPNFLAPLLLAALVPVVHGLGILRERALRRPEKEVRLKIPARFLGVFIRLQKEARRVEFLERFHLGDFFPVHIFRKHLVPQNVGTQDLERIDQPQRDEGRKVPAVRVLKIQPGGRVLLPDRVEHREGARPVLDFEFFEMNGRWKVQNPHRGRGMAQNVVLRRKKPIRVKPDLIGFRLLLPLGPAALFPQLRAIFVQFFLRAGEKTQVGGLRKRHEM